MAVTAAQVTEFGKAPIGNGYWDIWFKYTGPASYTSGGEDLTRIVCKQAMEGISEIEMLAAAPAGGASYASIALCTFEPINDGTNTGTFHYGAAGTGDAHTHDLSIIGGQAAAATDTVFVPAATDLLGKQEAGNALVLGADVATKGGVVASAAGVSAGEVAAASNFSTFTCWFRGLGKM
jgi:hypothetical protein